MKRYPDRWVFEAAIPFKTLRYKKDIIRWGINFSRNDLTTTEKSSWTPIPRQLATASLAYTGVLDWDAPPPRAGRNISLIPFVVGNGNRRYQPNQPFDGRADVGLDAKVSITSSMNLDATANPDFSQVEVDRQVTNLDRFELFFPERRQFFLENRDLFAMYGFPDTRPFFSRRIGLAYNPVAGRNEKVPIVAGARLSGKLTDGLRIGLLCLPYSRLRRLNLRINLDINGLEALFSKSECGLRGFKSGFLAIYGTLRHVTIVQQPLLSLHLGFVRFQICLRTIKLTLNITPSLRNFDVLECAQCLFRRF